MVWSVWTRPTPPLLSNHPDSPGMEVTWEAEAAGARAPGQEGDVFRTRVCLTFPHCGPDNVRLSLEKQLQEGVTVI